MDELMLFDDTGRRKYVCASEHPRFLAAARRAELLTRAFCLLLAMTGCRLSEALAVTPARLDAEISKVIFRTLKRRKLVFRAIPIPPELMADLRLIAKDRAQDAPLWAWSRKTAWVRVKAIMEAAGIAGPQAMPKGLRHGFGVANAEENVPMGTTKKWLGHAKLETTAIYQEVVGSEEKAFARRLWRKWSAGECAAPKN